MMRLFTISLGRMYFAVVFSFSKYVADLDLGQNCHMYCLYEENMRPLINEGRLVFLNNSTIILTTPPSTINTQVREF